MKRPAVFFDRDNTLIANDGYLGEPDKVALIQGAADAIARVRSMGFAAVTFSNQSGVARGLFAEEVVHAVNSRLDEMLQDQNPRAVIDRHEFCPYHPEATVDRYRQDSDLRKPKPGMILQAAERLGLDVAKSWVIGDAPRDIEAGKTAGCRTILFRDPALKPSPAASETSTQRPEFLVTSLKEAVDIIERNTMNKGQAQSTDGAVDTAQGAVDKAQGGPVQSPGKTKPNVAVEKPPASEAPTSSAAPGRKPTFAERVRAGTFMPARDDAAASADPQRPKRAVAAETASDATPQVRATEPLSEAEEIAPILQEILEEVRLLRQRQPYAEFAVSKLLAGIVQVLVLPALFFAYLHRDTPLDLQSSLILASVLQTMTIALLIMGRQS